MRRIAWFTAVLAVVGMVFSASGGAVPGTQFHGIAFNKGCQTPTSIGAPYECAYQILNVADTAHDTLTINSIVDTVNTCGAATLPGEDPCRGSIHPLNNLLPFLYNGGLLTFTNGGNGASFCTPTGAGGVFLDGDTCTLPYLSTIITGFIAQLNPNGSDWKYLPDHTMTDTADLRWQDTCVPSDGTLPSSNCTPNQNLIAQGQSQTLILQLPSQTTTEIHDGSHNPVTAVAVGTTVHDKVTVTGVGGNPPPTGNVTIDWFANGADCPNGQPTASMTVPLVPGPGSTSTVDADSFAFLVNSVGHKAFRAHYLGDNTYLPSDGDCEPLTVVDARITITPNGTNRVGATHTFTATVFVNDGNGETLAPDNTHVTFTIDSDTSGGATPNPPTACDTSGGTGSCATTITSPNPGVTTVSAHTTVTVLGVPITRDTDSTHGSSGPATKTWVDARIHITPDDTNEVGQPHTFTVHLEKNLGAGWVDAPGEHVDVTLQDFFGANHTAPTGTCTNAGPNTDLNGECQITFTSPTTGQVVGTASASLNLGTPQDPITVTTNGVAPNGGPATKTFVDAYIEINPPQAANAVDTHHHFTATVWVDDGLGGGFVHAPDNTLVTFSYVGAHVGDFSPPGANTCMTSGGTGSCFVDTTSSVPGQDTMQASTMVDVGASTPGGPVTLTRTTGQASPGHANSGNAVKVWVKAQIHITPDDTNEVGQPHTFTALVEADTGSGFGPVNGANTTITLIPDGTANPTPAGPFNGLTVAGQFSATFTSPTPGQVMGHASATFTVSGVPFTIQTDGVAPNGGNATKTFVDAYIEINPPTDTDPVGDTHTFTATVWVSDGLGGGYVPAPDGTSITFSYVGVHVGNIKTPSPPNPPNPCTTSGGTGSCSVDTTSTSAGQDTMQAETTVAVGSSTPGGPVSLFRKTGTASPGHANGGNAVKKWADASVRTDILSAANVVITTASAGDVVHDKAFVTKDPNTPAGVPDPTGNVVFHRYATIDCTGPSVDETVPLAGGTAVSSDFTVTGAMSYKADYDPAGDPNYPARTGACEPLNVTTTLPCPAGSFSFQLLPNGDLSIVYDQFPAPNDNSYGVNAVGWGTKGHKFNDLVGSDHAGFALVDPGGTTQLDFNIDYITAETLSPAPAGYSGYQSLGPFGGDGKVNVGSLNTDPNPATNPDISWDSSLARNLNTLGYCTAPLSCVHSGTNLLVDSPPVTDTSPNSTYQLANPGDFANGWDFHDTYFVTIKAAKLASLGFDINTWKVQPNPDELHNSPAKPCPCPAGVDPNPTLTATDNGNGTTTFTYAQSLAVNDNSYGAGTDPSWAGKTHKFSDLTGSDKAEFVISDAGGGTLFDFTLDYLSAKSGTPSGYGSLGPFGGDGSFKTGNQAAIVSWTTSLDDNLNVLNGGACSSFIVDSPPSPADTGCPGWNFQNVYQVTIQNSALPAGYTWDVPFVHNSPSKPTTCPATTPPPATNIVVGDKKVDKKEVRVQLTNKGSADAFVTGLAVTWPQATNGNLVQIKLGGDVIYGGPGMPPIGGGSATLTSAQLTHDMNKLKLKKGEKQDFKLVFQNNASTNLSLYTGTVSFGTTDVTILP
jgi:hypothetical protein